MSNYRNLIFGICLFYLQESFSGSFITPLTLDGLEELSRGEEGQKKGEYTAFVNLQFIAIAPDGQRSFQSVRPPIVPIDLVYTSIANGKGVPREEIVAKSESEIREIIAKSNLRIGADVLSGPAFKDALDNAFLIQKLSRIDDEKTMYATLAFEMKSESYLKKVDFLSSFLYYLNQNYDYTSLGINGTADIKATDMDLMRGIRESIRTGKPVEAGVCRHMHKLAIKMAQAMGIENAYTVAYNTSDSAHMNMVIQDPADPTRVFQLNYSYKKEITGLTGPEALTQNHGGLPSDGINLRVFNHKDEHAITLPTEEGGILNRVTGGEDRDLSPDYKSKSQFRQAGVQTPYGTVRFFNASSPLGNQGQVSGAAYNVRLTYNDLYYGEYGVAGFMSERVILEKVQIVRPLMRVNVWITLIQAGVP
jgi:hypothetical protein